MSYSEFDEMRRDAANRALNGVPDADKLVYRSYPSDLLAKNCIWRTVSFTSILENNRRYSWPDEFLKIASYLPFRLDADEKLKHFTKYYVYAHSRGIITGDQDQMEEKLAMLREVECNARLKARVKTAPYDEPVGKLEKVVSVFWASMFIIGVAVVVFIAEIGLGYHQDRSRSLKITAKPSHFLQCLEKSKTDPIYLKKFAPFLEQILLEWFEMQQTRL